MIMLNMVDNLLSFVNWLNQVMQEKNITQADIARSGFVTTAAVSKLFTMSVKSVGKVPALTKKALLTRFKAAKHRA